MTIDPTRVRETAQRIRNGEKPEPMFTRDIKPAGEQGFVVITSVGRYPAGRSAALRAEPCFASRRYRAAAAIARKDAA